MAGQTADGEKYRVVDSREETLETAPTREAAEQERDGLLDGVELEARRLPLGIRAPDGEAA